MSEWSQAFLLESKVADIISEQARYGCNFDKEKAKEFVEQITQNIKDIDEEVVPILPMMMHTNNKSYYKKPFKLNGQFMNYVQKYAENVGLERSEVCGPFSPVWYTPFDPAKTAALKKVMMDNGWVPNEWNEKKMDFDARKLGRMARGCQTFPQLLRKLPHSNAEQLSLIIDGFIAKHFKNQSKTYMVTFLKKLGFKKKEPPTFHEIKLKLCTMQFWPTSPKFTDDADETGEENKLLRNLLARMQWSHRKSLIQGLIEKTRPDGKLEGQMNPCATPTARGAHRIIANIPSVGSLFGAECRSLFIGDANPDSPEVVRDGKVKPAGQDWFIGADAAGLELRVLTHYLIWVSKKYNDKAALKAAYAYRDQVLDGDIHTHNQKLAGLPTRNSAKSFIYAWLVN